MCGKLNEKTAGLKRIVEKTAEECAKIRAAWLNGSLVNPEVTPDPWQDVDAVFAVNDMEPFLSDVSWLSRFGEAAIIQTPDDGVLSPGRKDRYAFLMQFTDGTRLDLTFCLVKDAPRIYREDSLVELLLDKEELLEPAEPDASSWYIQLPSNEEAAACWNEFWWLAPYTARGLLRGEMLYALDHLETARRMLRRMLVWRAVYERGKPFNPGKSDKWLLRCLSEEEEQQLKHTYPQAEAEAVWDAWREAAELMEKSAAALPYAWNWQEAEQVKQLIADWKAAE
ncbi:aminoglycoside 6-adenylyltransferase [Alkalicoccus urumqiensis]|nr:aminoglycoside 6-adenylyltransferase [Alkalicoccus urumqiensis]